MTRKQINQRIAGATALVTIATHSAVKWSKVIRAWFLKKNDVTSLIDQAAHVVGKGA